MKSPILLYLLTIFGLNATAQPQLTRDDTLRGSITPQRSWWDLSYYVLDVTIHPDDHYIKGIVEVHYTVLQPGQTLQMDLQPPLKISEVSQDGAPVKFRKIGTNAYWLDLQKPQIKSQKETVIVHYEGHPIVATNPPWEGGFQWEKDEDGHPFIATSCQGLGASAWWPCKDHMYDEVDSMLIRVTVPDSLTDVSNGRLRQVTSNGDGTKTFDWFVSNPINNYGVNVNVANYVSFADTLHGEKGVLDLEFYALPYNLQKARSQFRQAKLMLKAFEYWFGPYPFYDDGYKLVEVPYLGMEHQSSITYGNGYQNGYLGNDLSRSGWGLKWDFIIIHESAHEWFANSITYKDMADMWIHESFANYSETLYTEYYFGKKAGSEYVIGTREGIHNDFPIIGTYHVNKSGSGDMYPKGGNMLHTIRQIVDNDEKWRQLLRGMSSTFYHQTVDTDQIENYISEKAARNLDKVFDQYLRDVRIPVFEYSIRRGKLKYRWTNVVDKFDMPLKIITENGKQLFIYPTTAEKSMRIEGHSISVDENFYVTVSNLGSR
ncbi:MAG TPA: M1 family metallopeptidase [Chryseolinea sp.]|nr:M1 family metallopeptidase [Chryseolinea sp.]